MVKNTYVKRLKASFPKNIKIGNPDFMVIGNFLEEKKDTNPKTAAKVGFTESAVKIVSGIVNFHNKVVLMISF